MGRKGKDKQLQITDVLKATGDYLKAVEKGKEKAECAKQFDREMQRLHAQFEFLDRLTENVELPREIQSQIEEIHMDCKSFNKTFNVIEERMDSEKTTFVSWIPLLKPAVLSLGPALTFYLAMTSTLPYLMTGLMVTIIFAVLFCNDHYKRVMDAWDEAADKEVYEMADRLRDHRETIKDYCTLQNQLRVNRVYDVSQILQDKVAMGFWVANFGGNVHAVEAERLTQMIIYNTDMRIKENCELFLLSLTQQLAAEYYLNYLGPWDDKNLPPERDEDGNIVEKRDSQGYIIKPKVRKPGPGEVWWKNLVTNKMFDEAKQIRPEQKTRQQAEWEIHENVIRKAVKKGVIISLYEHLDEKDQREAELSDLQRNRLFAAIDRVKTERAKLLQSGRLASEGLEAAIDALESLRSEIGSEAVEKLVNPSQKDPRKSRLEVLKVHYELIKGALQDVRDRGYSLNKLREFVMEVSTTYLEDSSKWLARGDYRPRYLRLDSKRRMIYQIINQLAVKRGDGFVSAYEFQELVQRFGKLDFILERIIKSLILISNKSTNISSAEWFRQPWFILDSRDEKEIISGLAKYGEKGEFLICPAHSSQTLKLCYLDEKSNVVQLNIENNHEESMFSVPKWNRKDSKKEEYSFFTLGDLVESQKKKEILKQPFVNPEMLATFNIRGKHLTIPVDVFLEPKFDMSELYKLFQTHSKDNSSELLGSFWKDTSQEIYHGGDLTLFNVIINLFRYCKEEDPKHPYRDSAIVPQNMPESFYRLLKDELREWKMPYNVEVKDGKGVLKYNRNKVWREKKRMMDMDMDDGGSVASAASHMDMDMDMDNVVMFEAPEENSSSGRPARNRSRESLSGYEEMEFFDDFDEVRVKMDQDITLEEHYEVLMGLPRFDEDPEGSVERLPFSSGDKVEYLSKTKGTWNASVIRKWNTDGTLTVTLNVSGMDKIAPLERVRHTRAMLRLNRNTSAADDILPGQRYY
ncbi:hypothetical protein AAMO2058_000869400 [Amorphochlora amoebiformis]|mmetsp:Transcript_27963/g.44506  ORF Transcript_27963/g.44506 Transcript_27963/m.44506 type:complete len:974 (-) Transcript_27963:168-3089(-)